MQKNIICVSCPMGCGITVELNDSGEVVSATPASAETHTREQNVLTRSEALQRQSR